MADSMVGGAHFGVEDALEVAVGGVAEVRRLEAAVARLEARGWAGERERERAERKRETAEERAVECARLVNEAALERETEEAWQGWLQWRAWEEGHWAGRAEAEWRSRWWSRTAWEAGWRRGMAVADDEFAEGEPWPAWQQGSGRASLDPVWLVGWLVG